jgi:hypothetical protein
MKIYQAVQTLLVGNRQADILEWSKSTLMSLLHYNISSKSTKLCKGCIVLRSLKVRHFEMVEATGLNSMSSCPYKISSKSTDWFKCCTTQKFKRPTFWSDRRHLQCYHLHTEFHPNPPISWKTLSGGSLHPPHKFKRPPFWNGLNCGIK